MQSAPTARLLADVQPQSSRQLLLAALDAFAIHGYHGATTRDIARRAGLSPAAVYVHYRSKAELLRALSQIGHQIALQAVEDAIASESDPGKRLYRGVHAFATWHAEHPDLARVVQYELDALSPDAYREIRALRRRFDRLFQAELRNGQDAGAFDVDDVPGTTLAILSLCIDVARWYKPTQGRPPTAIGELYAELSLRMVRARTT